MLGQTVQPMKYFYRTATLGANSYKSTMLFPVIWAIFLAAVFATPPACFLGCINDISRFCPDKQADVECICHLNEAVDQCVVQYCHGIHQLSARDHFAGTCSEYEFEFERSDRQQWPVIDPLQPSSYDDNSGDHSDDNSDDNDDHNDDHSEDHPDDNSEENSGDDDSESNNSQDLSDCKSDPDSEDISKQVLQSCMEFILKSSGRAKHKSVRHSSSRNSDEGSGGVSHGYSGSSTRKRRPKRKGQRGRRPNKYGSGN